MIFLHKIHPKDEQFEFLHNKSKSYLILNIEIFIKFTNFY